MNKVDHKILSINWLIIAMMSTITFLLIALIASMFAYIGYDLETYHPEKWQPLFSLNTLFYINIFSAVLSSISLFSWVMAMIQTITKWYTQQVIKKYRISVIK